MKKLIIIAIAAMVFATSYRLVAQTVTHTKTDTTQTLSELIVIGKFDFTQKQKKVLSSLDSYLESNPAVNMIKRGAYAWEPLLNGMATERSVITIDGMRIYGACTDKMDPITSYVEITNLSKANIQSGQSGGIHGATIAGSIDLMRSRSDFDGSGFKGTLLSGFESNNSQKILGSKLQFAGNRFFTDVDFMVRDAKNYSAGGGGDVLYSHFSKYNLSATAGWKLDDHQSLTASLIYDDAHDIGYPALPMDVSSAKAAIASLEYVRHHISANIDQWETKIYYNEVTHVMDDTKRPFVPVRMDMPGWSKTSGFYSMIRGEAGNHKWKVNLSGHYNKSLAEMTMYSNEPSQSDMFMLTWPGVATYFSSLFFADQFKWNETLTSDITFSTSLHDNEINNSLGLESLKIFYPNMAKGKLRLLGSLTTGLNYHKDGWNHRIGAGYGTRAPSISEGYGFYLFNSMDSFDYIGNPEMKNEKSLEFNASSSYGFGKGMVKAQLSYFKLYDYIVGKPQPSLSSMTIGANGIKRYEQLSSAEILNANVSVDQSFTPALRLTAKAQYRFGKAEGFNLPQIQPFGYGLAIKYEKNSFSAETSLEGAAAQKEYAVTFGETPAADYMLLHIALSKQVKIASHKILLKTGVENIFDKRYRTFADWNNIPRMGRNLYLNLVYNF